MRIRELSLLRYGHLSDVVLAIPRDAGLCVVHGANEAGKSTALAAIGDALFGFGHRTAFDFKHGGPQLRVGLTLAAADGAEASFIRRKGRNGTLRGIDDEILPELALQRFLGGASREVFDHMFGLNGDRLRVGGATLAQEGSGVGESLFAAGSGLMGLRAALAKLDEEAKALFGDGRGKRRVLEAVDAWSTAQKASDALGVPPRAWQDATKSHADTQAALARVQVIASHLREEASRLQRVRRVAPLLQQLEKVRATLSDLANTPQLPRDARAKLLDTTATRRQSDIDRGRETAAATELATKLDQLERAPQLLKVQDSIDRLAEQRPVAVQAEADFSSVKDEAIRHRLIVVGAIADLKPGLTAEQARETVPAASVRRAVQSMANAHPALAAAAEVAAKNLNAAIERRDQSAARLARCVIPSDPALLRATIDRVRGEGRLDTDFVKANSEFEGAQARAVAALAGLPLWHDSAQALAACPSPLPAEMNSAKARLENADAAVLQGFAKITDTTADLAVCDAAVARLATGGLIPTPALVTAARAERDATWMRIREELEQSEKQLSAQARHELSASFERLRNDADRLADQRADEAQRVADYVLATNRRALLREQLQKAIETHDLARERQAQAQAGWCAIWAPAGITPASPAGMTDWMHARADVLKLHSAAADFGHRRQELVARCLAARNDLARVMPGLLQDDTIAAALTQAEVACAAIEADVKSRAALKDVLQREIDALPGLEKAVIIADEAHARWQNDWTGSIAPLAFGSLDIAAAQAALDAWSRVAEAAPAWLAGEARLQSMTRCIDAFTEAVAAVVGLIGDEAMRVENAPAVAARLIRDLAKARETETEAARLMDRIAAHTQAASTARKLHTDAEADIETLRLQAGVADDEALQSAIDSASLRNEAADKQVELLASLTVQSDGLDEATLSMEAVDYHPDVAVARLSKIEAETTECDTERDTLTAVRVRLEAELRIMGEGRDAAGAAQTARQALAEAVAGAERYARLHMARVLLRSGIDRFRRAQQGPLLKAAGHHFATLTGGRYARLGVDESDDGRPLLVAVNANAIEIPVEALSEGTRDQLYLALRVASIEAYSATAEPLPFIADDLLVHFDDERASAAIRLLGQLGRTTQVILFSHHDHVARLAEAENSSDISVIRLVHDSAMSVA